MTKFPVKFISSLKRIFPDVFPTGFTTQETGPMAKVLGFDTSRHNHNNDKPIDFHAAYNAGYRFWAGRATVGDYYQDPWFRVDFDSAKSAGFITMAYHVIAPETQDSAQIANFINALNGRAPDAVVIDAELVRSQTPVRITACIGNHVKGLPPGVLRELPIMYTNQNYGDKYILDTFGLDLWVANPDNVTPSLPSKWDTWVIWQKSWTTAIPGVPDSTVDLDEFNGNEEEFSAYFSAQEPEPMECCEELLEEIRQLRAAVDGIQADVTWLIENTDQTPPPTPLPPDTTLVATITRDPRANAFFYTDTDDKGKPIMKLYPAPDAPVSDRVQYAKGEEVIVDMQPVIATGMDKFWKIAQELPAGVGVSLYLKDAHVAF